MAKNAGTLAGLAALAGAAYLMNKDKDKGTTDSNPTRAARPESTETRLKTPAQSIAEADKSDKSSSISTKGESGVTTPGPDTSAPNLSYKPVGTNDKRTQFIKGNAPSANAPAATADDTSSTPLSSVTRAYKDPEKQKVYDTLSDKAGANTSSALRSDQLANVSRAVKRESKTKQFAQDVPYQESAQKTDALAVASRAARAADAKRRAAKQSSYKKGGMVTKVSSASKRADGIASRGKTKCKMY